MGPGPGDRSSVAPPPLSVSTEMANTEIAEKKPSAFNSALGSVREYFRDTFGELRKVKWPTRLDTRNLTTIVLAVTVAMSVVLGAFDYAFENLFIGMLKATPDLVAVAVGASIVLGIIIIVVFAGRERR